MKAPSRTAGAHASRFLSTMIWKLAYLVSLMIIISTNPPKLVVDILLNYQSSQVSGRARRFRDVYGQVRDVGFIFIDTWRLAGLEVVEVDRLGQSPKCIPAAGEPPHPMSENFMLCFKLEAYIFKGRGRVRPFPYQVCAEGTGIEQTS